MAEMTREAIEKCIKEHDGYMQPQLNDQLYLHCKGFMKIEPVIGLYSKVKALWLQQNAIGTIENLDELAELGCLYLHQNCITKISGLEKLTTLHTLNLSNNYITKIEGLEALPQLESLMLAHNRIAEIEGLRGVTGCAALSCLDVSNNGLRADKEKGEKPEDVIDLLAQLPALACLYIQGNELPNQTRYFRRRMVGSIKSLTYMDERPVFPEDRRATDAWMVGGFEAEQAERDLIREEKKQAEKESLAKYRAMQEKGRALKEQRERELAEREAAQARWAEENKVVFERERREVWNDEEDARTEIFQSQKRAAGSLEAAAADSLAAALAAEREREDRFEQAAVRRRVWEEAKRELEQDFAAIADLHIDPIADVEKMLRGSSAVDEREGPAGQQGAVPGKVGSSTPGNPPAAAAGTAATASGGAAKKARSQPLPAKSAIFAQYAAAFETRPKRVH